MIVKPRLYIVSHGKILKEADILEGSCDSLLIDIHRMLAGDIHAVQKNTSAIGTVNSGQQIKDGSLSGTIGADQAIELSLFNPDIEIVHRL